MEQGTENVKGFIDEVLETADLTSDSLDDSDLTVKDLGLAFRIPGIYDGVRAALGKLVPEALDITLIEEIDLYKYIDEKVAELVADAERDLFEKPVGDFLKVCVTVLRGGKSGVEFIQGLLDAPPQIATGV